VQALSEILPALFRKIAGIFRLRRAVMQAFAKSGIVELGASNAEHLEVARSAAHARQIVERRNELAMREIAGTTEDHDQAVVAFRQRGSF
jgi:hypothetical protein